MMSARGDAEERNQSEAIAGIIAGTPEGPSAPAAAPLGVIATLFEP